MLLLLVLNHIVLMRLICLLAITCRHLFKLICGQTGQGTFKMVVDSVGMVVDSVGMNFALKTVSVAIFD